MMTKLEIIKKNQREYAELEEKIKTMPEGLEKVVAINITLPWIKGVKWMGGLSGMREQKCYERVEKLGYDFETAYDEFHRQVETYN